MPNIDPTLDPRIEPLEGSAADAVEEQVEAEMEAFNTAALGEEDNRRTVLQAVDERGQRIGALVAWSCWDYLYLENLWVEPSARGRGIGAQLVQALEARARAQGFRMIQLYTFSFEAPRFYQRLGFTLAGSIADAPTGTTNHWFYKRL